MVIPRSITPSERGKKKKEKKENGRANIILNRTGILVESFYLATNCSSCRFLGVRSITTRGSFEFLLF